MKTENPTDQNFFIDEEKPDHHYRTEIPNVVFDLGLEAVTLAVYSYLKRISGDCGKCWQSMPNLAKKIGIGETKLRECLAELVDGKNRCKIKLVKKIYRVKEDGSPDTCVFMIIDIWGFNGRFYKGGGGSPSEGGVVRQTNQGGSPNEDKEELSKKNPLEEQTTPMGVQPSSMGCCSSQKNKNKKADQGRVAEISELLKDFKIKPSLIQKFAKKDSKQVNDAIAAFKQQMANGATPKTVEGYLVSLVNCEAKPNITKEDIGKQQQEVIANRKLQIELNHKKALKIEEQYAGKYKNGFNVIVREQLVEFRSPQGFNNSSLGDPQTIKDLTEFCIRNCKT